MVFKQIRSPRRRLFKWFALVLCLLFWTPTTNAVDFELLDLDGNRHRLSEYLGKWVVINFWATWCSPCLKEIPELIGFQSRHESDVVVLGINFEDGPLPDVKDFVASLGINYLVLRSGEEPLAPFEPLKGLPSTFLVSPEAEYLDVVLGAVTAAELEDLVTRYRDLRSQNTKTD